MKIILATLRTFLGSRGPLLGVLPISDGVRNCVDGRQQRLDEAVSQLGPNVSGAVPAKKGHSYQLKTEGKAA